MYGAPRTQTEPTLYHTYSKLPRASWHIQKFAPHQGKTLFPAPVSQWIVLIGIGADWNVPQSNVFSVTEITKRTRYAMTSGAAESREPLWFTHKYTIHE